MTGFVLLLMYAISFMCPVVAYISRKELGDAAKAWLILYWLAMFMFATIALYTWVELV